MGADLFLVLLGGLLVLAFLAEEAMARFHVPPVLVLIGSGLLLGPATHVLPAERFIAVAPHFGALAFLLILFEGGLDLELGSVVRGLRGGLSLAVVGFALAALVVLALAMAAGLPPAVSAAYAIVLAPISGSIVLPLAGRLGLRPAVRTVLVLEAALADVLGVLAMGLLSRLETGGGIAGLLAVGSLLAAGLSVLLALLLGLAWPRVIRLLGERRFVDVLTFGLAMLLWGAADGAGASGALVVLVFGVTLANEEAILGSAGVRGGALGSLGAVARDTVTGLHSFIAQLTFIVRTFFFVFLGVVVQFADLSLREYALAGAAVALLLLTRRLVLEFVESRGGLAVTGRERTGLMLLQPRGLVSAVLALEAVHLGLDGEGAMLGVTSVVILATNTLLLPGARRLTPGPGIVMEAGPRRSNSGEAPGA